MSEQLQTTRRTRHHPRALDPASPAFSGAPLRRGRPRPRQVDTRTPFERTSAPGRWLWLGVDTLALGGLLVLLAIGFDPTFATPWLFVTVLGGGLVGLLVGWVGWRLALNTGTVALAGIAAWFLVGGPLAMPSTTTGGVIPSPRTLRGLALGPVTAWKDMLTLDPPIGETWNLLCVPLLLAMGAGVLAASISLRTDRPQLAWLPGAITLALAWALGTHVSRWPLWTAIATVALVLIWTTHRRRMLREVLVRQRRRPQLHQIILAVLVLAVASTGTWLLAPLVTPDQTRASARTLVQPPLEVYQYGSPLQSMRGVVSMHAEDVMFSVRGAPGAGVIRLATLDTYNGLTYNVSNDASPVSGGGRFTRVGARIIPLVEGPRSQVEVTIGQQGGVWLPTVGQTTAVRFHGGRAITLTDTFHYNRVSGTGLSTAGLQPGDSYTLQVVTPARPTDAQIAGSGAGVFPQPELVGVPDLVREQATTWTQGASTKGEAALKLVEQLRLGYYSNGLDKQARSLSGHSADRVTALLLNPAEMVGDEEQYAVAMALMARSLNIPARVVYGYQAPEGGSGDVRGQDVRAWTELNLQGHGWVLFNPTPDHDRILKQETQQSPPRPRPHIDIPAPPPKRPDTLPNENTLPAQQGEAPVPPVSIDWKRVGTLFAVFAVPLLAVFGPIALIIGLKGRRRLTRKNHPVPANRVAGAWSELVDQVRDLGRTPPPTATRSEQAEQMVVTFPRMITDADPISLAKRADALVFSPDKVSDEQAAAYWTTMREAERGVRRSVGWRRWITSKLSVRSFRRFS